MSEFSESYHLRSGNQEEGAALLERANLKGFVFPAENDWVTILAEGSMFEPNQWLIAANTGKLLHYINAEDHGWSFAVYDGSELVSHYECSWDDDIEVDSDINMSVVAEFLKPAQKGMSADQLEQLLALDDEQEIAMETPAVDFAEMVGLTNYEWLSYAYAEKDYDEDEERFAGVARVG